ncbi:universal stress protein [Paenisporosarcina sp. TG20]|uniref:universal stress protein n=1 Tax=Paenisporosarcina sp. TG20 TaxID=1211706 RepID=UPI0002EA2A6B|nr:universal stress protein [Paenisporosarcina sp. TG20]
MSNVIVVPTDGSNGSIKALQYAIDLAKKTDGEIILLNVQPNFASPNVRNFFSKNDVEEYTQMLADEQLKTAKGIMEEAGVPYQAKVRTGLTKVEICQETKEAEASLIVMGYRGLGAVAGVVLGSVSYGVLHDAPCPVTIVR